MMPASLAILILVIALVSNAILDYIHRRRSNDRLDRLEEVAAALVDAHNDRVVGSSGSIITPAASSRLIVPSEKA